jgi:hypothetical protein
MAEVTRELIGQIREAGNAALREVGEVYGVELKLGNGKYSGTTGSIKLEIIGSMADGRSAADVEWERYARIFGLDDVALGTTFTVRGRTFRITALKPNRPRYPISADDVETGKGFKFPTATVRGAIPINALA